MPSEKEHKEFHSVAMDGEGWHSPPGYPPDIEQKILAGGFDADHMMGSRTRLLRFKPGAHTTVAFVHDYWEEVYLISGDLIVDGGDGQHPATFLAPVGPPFGDQAGVLRVGSGALLSDYSLPARNTQIPCVSSLSYECPCKMG